MPITKSAKKSLKVSEIKREHNKVLKIELEKAIKKVSASNINEVISKIDKAAKVKIISKNKAARIKSALSKKFGTPKNVKVKSEKVNAPTKMKKGAVKNSSPKK
ncbi:MAG: 30S ribosomal protein S20 [Patescibacteria group bacterium]|jgi:ribosomal protein S20